MGRTAVSKINVELEPIEKSLVGRALDGLCVGLVTTNAQGRVTWLNRVAQRVLGLDSETSQGRSLASLLQDPKLAEFWREALAGEETVTCDVALTVPTSAHLKANATTSLDAEGRLIGRALMFCDVTAERTVQLELSAAATERLLNITGAGPEGGAPAKLTPQENRVLRLVGEGLSNRQIAERMNVAPSTVRSHLKHLYAKLGIRSRSEAISYALRSAGLP